ncbi:MAG: hypothetical protein ABIG89_01925 [Candidatus Woesearchaeota archaeon]
MGLNLLKIQRHNTSSREDVLRGWYCYELLYGDDSNLLSLNKSFKSTPPEDLVREANYRHLKACNLKRFNEIRACTQDEPSHDDLRNYYKIALFSTDTSNIPLLISFLNESFGSTPPEDLVLKAYQYHFSEYDFEKIEEIKLCTQINPQFSSAEEFQYYITDYDSYHWRDGTRNDDLEKVVEILEVEAPEMLIQEVYTTCARFALVDLMKNIQQFTGVVPDIPERFVQMGYQHCRAIGNIDFNWELHGLYKPNSSRLEKELRNLTGVEPNFSMLDEPAYDLSLDLSISDLDIPENPNLLGLYCILAGINEKGGQIFASPKNEIKKVNKFRLTPTEYNDSDKAFLKKMVSYLLDSRNSLYNRYGGAQRGQYYPLLLQNVIGIIE